MILAVMISLLVLATAQLSLTAALYVRLCPPDKQERQEREVDKYLRRDPMDEGFENIMSFQVSGKTGFESSDRE